MPTTPARTTPARTTPVPRFRTCVAASAPAQHDPSEQCGLWPPHELSAPHKPSIPHEPPSLCTPTTLHEPSWLTASNTLHEPSWLHASTTLHEPSPGENYSLRSPHAPDYDGVWKHALHTWLPDCLALFWPDIRNAIDWRTQPAFLDKELKRFGRQHRTLRRRHSGL